MKKTFPTLLQSSCRAISVGLLVAVSIGCKQTPTPADSRANHSDTMNQQRFESLYHKWRTASEAMPRYSKTTAYSNLREFADIVACGKAIVPLLRDKIEEDKGVDFVLSVAVVEIMGWPDDQFPTTDMTQLRASVLQWLDSAK